MEMRATEEGESESRSVAEWIPAIRTAQAGRLPSGLSHEKTWATGLRGKADDDSESCWCGLAHENVRWHQAIIVQVAISESSPRLARGVRKAWAVWVGNSHAQFL